MGDRPGHRRGDRRRPAAEAGRVRRPRPARHRRPGTRSTITSCATATSISASSSSPAAIPTWLTLSRPYYTASYVARGRGPGLAVACRHAARPADRHGDRHERRLRADQVHPDPARRRALAPLPDGRRTRRPSPRSRTAPPAPRWSGGRRPGRSGRPTRPMPASASSRSRRCPTPPLGVGAALLAKQTFLRASIDQAIGDLDGRRDDRRHPRGARLSGQGRPMTGTAP